MKSIGKYTRQDPIKCFKMLLKFADRITDTKEIADNMEGWKLQFSVRGYSSRRQSWT
jgi:hypothetical protein